MPLPNIHPPFLSLSRFPLAPMKGHQQRSLEGLKAIPVRLTSQGAKAGAAFRGHHWQR